MDSQVKKIDIKGIIESIPHRYPFLLIDRVDDLMVGESAVGIKAVTMNEWFFAGHFPSNPVMPGVLIIEALAQTAAVLVAQTIPEVNERSMVYFMSIERVRFRSPVVPGDLLRLHVRKKHSRGKVWKFQGNAYVDGTLVAEAIYTAMLG